MANYNTRFREFNGSGVYLITNKINNKIYVGSTKQKFRERWSQHISEFNKGTHKNKYLCNAWRKYGIDSFDFSVLEEIPVELLKHVKGYQKKKEQYWLDLFQPFGDRGYNIATNAEFPNPRVYDIKDRINASKSKIKDGYLIETPEGLILHTYSVELFSEGFPELNLNAKSLRAVAQGINEAHRGFKCYYADGKIRKVFTPLVRIKLEERTYRQEGCIEYILFDSKGNRYETSNISYFCDVLKPELKGKSLDLRGVARKENLIAHGWQCYLKGEEPKEFITYEELRDFKKYRIITPKNELLEVNYLSKFCSDNKLNPRVMAKCASPNYPNITYKGYYCFEWDDEGYLKILNPPEVVIIPTIEETDYNFVFLRWVNEMNFEEYKLQNYMDINKYLPEENFLQPNLSKVKNKINKSYKSTYYFTKDFNFDANQLTKPAERKPQRNTKRESKCLKSYKLTDPAGKIYTTDHLPNFAEEHKLKVQNLRQVAKGTKGSHQGWLCTEIV